MACNEVCREGQQYREKGTQCRLSETAPSEGTLRVFPDVLLSNAYIILRPFVRLRATAASADALDAANWEFGQSLNPFQLHLT